MISKKQYANYAKSINIMHDISIEIMATSSPEELLSLFAEGFIENNVVELMSFFGEKVRYGIPN